MIDLTEIVKRTGAKRTLTIIVKELHSIKDKSEGGSTIEYEVRILFRKDDYDYIYRRDNRFMMIVKNNVIVREINWGRIIDILYVDDYDNNKGFCREVI